MPRKIIIAAGGPPHYWPEIDHSEKAVYVGADRGVYHLLETGIIPHYAFGDFDSVTEEEKRKIQQADMMMVEYEKEKNATDLELALDWAVSQRPSSIELIGATGGRLDHALVNIQLMLKGLKNGVKTVMKDVQNEMELFLPGTYEITTSELGEANYISFLAFSSEVKGITLKGFKYPLEMADLHIGSSLCISNELADKSGTYSFTSGILLMVKSRD
ncbi:thiamine diphosphokinase [Fictibacillus iocasae]|uniref:Thiamine diphosphokinase n=1 Tax=Fictibacillus iocasae TaxID=2715437 RepID=A0ABW2NRZ4_9BACL